MAIDTEVLRLELNAIEARLRIQENWAAEHDGRINVLWSDQFNINKAHDRETREIHKRLTAIEKRLVWLVGVAAGTGALAPDVIERIYLNIFN